MGTAVKASTATEEPSLENFEKPPSYNTAIMGTASESVGIPSTGMSPGAKHLTN